MRSWLRKFFVPVHEVEAMMDRRFTFLEKRMRVLEHEILKLSSAEENADDEQSEEV